MNCKSNTLKSFSSESNQVSVKRIAKRERLNAWCFGGIPQLDGFRRREENCKPMKESGRYWTHGEHFKQKAQSLRTIRDLIVELVNPFCIHASLFTDLVAPFGFLPCH